MTYRWTASAENAIINAIYEGLTVEQAAERVGTTGRTAYRHAQRNPAFRAGLTLAIEEREATKERRPCGTITRYVSGCRCIACKQVAAERTKRLRHERLTRPIPATVKHGTYSTYMNWGCRCEPCKAAGSAANRSQYLARKARQV